jgi:hypothetical protein
MIVGATATAGIFGILKSLGIVASSFGVALRSLHKGEAVSDERNDRDVPVTALLVASL